MNTDPDIEEIDADDPVENEDVKNLMTEHDLDKDTAERAQELVDEGLGGIFKKSSGTRTSTRAKSIWTWTTKLS